MMEKKGSVGVRIFGVLFSLIALHGIYILIKHWFLINRCSSFYVWTALNIFLGIGIFRFRKWFYPLLYACTFFVIIGFITTFSSSLGLYTLPLNRLLGLFSMGIFLYPIALFYFTRPNVKRQFNTDITTKKLFWTRPVEWFRGDPKNKRADFTKFIASIYIIFGTLTILKSIDCLYLAIKTIKEGKNLYDSFGYQIHYYFLIVLFSIIFPILRVVSGVFVLKFKEIGRKILLYYTSTEVSVRLLGLYNNLYFCFLTKGIPLLAIFSKRSEGTQTMVVKISMWPNYLTIAIGILLIYFFTRPKVKEMFRRENLTITPGLG